MKMRLLVILLNSVFTMKKDKKKSNISQEISITNILLI